MSTRKMVVGNWKLNPATLAEARRIIKRTRLTAKELKNVEVVACPPFVFIPACVSKRDTTVAIGSQTVSPETEGPHTGEVSARQVVDVGATYTIVGHSEERQRGDTDERVSRRLSAALDAGLTPIICVGEKVRDENGAYLETLKEQIKNSLGNIAKKHSRDIIIAYEPVWAIGAKDAMQPADIYETSIFVKKVCADIFGPESAIKISVLYGGAVNPLNAADIIKTGKVDGLLVGRESVNMVGFVELLRAVEDII